MKTAFHKDVVRALKAAGCVFRRNNNGHVIFTAPDNSMIVVPRNLDDPRVAYRIVKQAGAKL